MISSISNQFVSKLYAFLQLFLIDDDDDLLAMLHGFKYS